MHRFCIFLLGYLIDLIYGYNLCVVGAGSGLGRELVYQAVTDRNMSVLALTSKKAIREPFRGDGYEDNENTPLIMDPLLDIDNYWTHIKSDYDALVICTGGKPFVDDYSDILTEKYLEHLSKKCTDVSIVSAYSVNNDTLEKFSIPFQIMGNFYLKDTYRAKRKQEELLKKYDTLPIRKKLFTPRALSYGKTLFPSTTREDLAKEILDAI